MTFEKKRFDLLAVGELLIDMTPVKHQQGTCFQPNPGGAPCNFLAMAQKMGAQTAFIGKVGADQFGRQLRQVVEGLGIHTAGLVMDVNVPTTLAFVHLNEVGDRSFSFYRKHCADVSLNLEEVDLRLVSQSRAFYFGSLAFTDEPMRSTVTALLKEAKAQGLLIAYDPNYRPPLWPSVETAVKQMQAGLVYADVLKVSDEEALLLTQAENLEAAAAQLSEHIALVCITLGAEGVLARFKDKTFIVPSVKVSAVDTTGAGDAFFGTLMQQIVCSDTVLADMTIEEIQEKLRLANIAAALCVQGFGAIPSLPDKEKVWQVSQALD